MNLVIGKENGKYVLIDYDCRVGQHYGSTIAIMQSEYEGYDPFDEPDLLQYAKEIVRIVREHTKLPKPSICATCCHFDIDNSECEIRDIAFPTPPRKGGVFWYMSCCSRGD